MTFADEPVDYSGRRFECGWASRPQTAADLADRVMGLARRLGAVDPAFGRLRPDPGMRKFRPGDLAEVVNMEPADLADLIDSRGRFDPPKPPAAVSQTGFNLLYRNDLKGLDPSFLSLSVRAGQYGPGRVENRVGLRPDTKHELWKDLDRGIEVLEALVETWDPDWASAYALIDTDDDEIGSRPWLAWTPKPLEPRPNPPYARPYPAPFPLDHAGPPAEVRAWRGGELQIWP